MIYMNSHSASDASDYEQNPNWQSFYSELINRVDN